MNVEDTNHESEETRKRSRSPSTTTAIESVVRPSKRQRRLKDTDEERHPQMAGRGPLSRAVLKREKKRARRMVRKAGGGGGGTMDIDDWEGLGGVMESTFTTGMEAVN